MELMTVTLKLSIYYPFCYNFLVLFMKSLVKELSKTSDGNEYSWDNY
jgi:hypothetical protein